MTQVLLAIDTSQGTAVALLVDGKVVSELNEPNPLLHAEQIGSLIAKCLLEAKTPPNKVTAVAVGNGPGPFTGLRVGLAAAKMFAEGVGVPILGVSSLDAIAFGEVLTQPVLVLTDARRSEVYYGLYQGKSKSGVPIKISGPGVAKQADLEQSLKDSNQEYQVLESPIKASLVGLLALAELSEGLAKTKVQANYLRAPDAVPAKGKKVSG